MTPTEVLAQALHDSTIARFRECPSSRRREHDAGHEVHAASILAALDALGYSVARTQDARDGEALRLLREALPEGFDCEVTFMQGDVWEVSVYDGPDVVAQFTEATIAAAALCLAIAAFFASGTVRA